MTTCDGLSCFTSSSPTGSFDWFSTSPCKNVLMIFAVIVILIVAYYLFLRTSYGDDMVNQDILNKKVIDICALDNCCSMWPVSHYFLFLALGFFFSECWVTIITLGILWEIIEVVAGTLVVGDKWERQALRDGETGDVEYSGSWWAGSGKDIFMDISGFLSGVILADIFNENQ